MMERAFKIVPISIQKFYVADSAYANEAIYNCLLNNDVNFAICLPEIVWGSLLKNYGNKITWHKTRIRFFCQSLKANHVWGLMGIIAYNLMRMVSFTIYPQSGCFVRTTRRRLVILAGEVIKHARSIEIRMMEYLAKEVNLLKMILRRLSFSDREDRLNPLLC
jgi:hypothetical protein